MNITETFYTADRAAWRAWLHTHHASAADIWLVSYRKETGVPSLAYSDAAEEALCVGWIDSTRKSIDEERYAQRFTPRKPKSGYSQPNIERLRKLIEATQVLPAVAASVRDLLAAPFVYPPDIMGALQAHEQAWTHFQTYSSPYQRIRIAYVDTARKRPDDFEKRLQHLIQKTAQNKQFGYGIEDFYG